MSIEIRKAEKRRKRKKYHCNSAGNSDGDKFEKEFRHETRVKRDHRDQSIFPNKYKNTQGGRRKEIV